MNQIITIFINPPIAIRTFDYCAYREGTEETGPYGWGKTSIEAANDLQDLEGDE